MRKPRHKASDSSIIWEAIRANALEAVIHIIVWFFAIERLGIDMQDLIRS